MKVTPDEAGRRAIEASIAQLKTCLELETLAHTDFMEMMQENINGTQRQMSTFAEQIAALELFRDTQWPPKE